MIAARFWIEKVRKLENGAQIASSFLNLPLNSEAENWTDTCNEAELPLSIAAWNTDHTMIELLLENGAQLDAVNRRNQTVFHTLIEVCIHNHIYKITLKRVKTNNMQVTSVT